MSYVTLILEALRAIPQVLKLLQSLWASIQKAREDALIRETQEAVRDGDTTKFEENIGSPRAGAPVSGDGIVSGPPKER